jgi:ethanolamine utilization protein EutN
VVATIKDPGMEGMRLLIVQPLDEHQHDSGACVVAADAVAQAGPGDVVYFVASREAAEAMQPRFVPVDHAIVGIVDDVEVRA